MREVGEGSGVYELSQREYFRLRGKASLEQNNNSPTEVRSYFVISVRGRYDLLCKWLSLWSGSEAEYGLFKAVSPDKIEEISGIPFSDFLEVKVGF